MGRIYLGTTDGEIAQYVYHVVNKSLQFHYEQSIRQPSKPRRAATCLQAIKQWNMLIGIVDNTLTIYDLKSNKNHVTNKANIYDKNMNKKDSMIINNNIDANSSSAK